MQKVEKGEGGETERVKKKEGRGIVWEYDEGHRGGDREAVGGREWEWREERSIVGEYDEGHRVGGNEGAGGGQIEGGEMKRDREGWRGKERRRGDDEEEEDIKER